MKAKRKQFGIWTDSSYIAKVDDNDKVYRKIRDMRRYYAKLEIHISVRRIIRQLHENPYWRRRLISQSDRAWGKNFYRSKWYHRCKRKIRP